MFRPVAWILTIVLASCANLSTYQTARVLPPKTTRFMLGYGYAMSPVVTAPVDPTERDKAAYIQRYYEFAARGGTKPNIDLGLKYTFPAQLLGDIKQQFLDWHGLAMAIGLGIGGFSTTSREEVNSGVNQFKLMVPFYLSYDLGWFLGIYTAAKYHFEYYFGTLNGISNMVSATAGVRIGNKWGLLVEGSYGQNLRYSHIQPHQISAALFFGNAPSVK